MGTSCAKKAKVGKKARTGQGFLIVQVTGEKGAGRDGDQPEIYVTSQDTDRQRRLRSPQASALESENCFGYFLRAPLPDVSLSTSSCLMPCREPSVLHARDALESVDQVKAPGRREMRQSHGFLLPREPESIIQFPPYRAGN